MQAQWLWCIQLWYQTQAILQATSRMHQSRYHVTCDVWVCFNWNRGCSWWRLQRLVLRVSWSRKLWKRHERLQTLTPFAQISRRSKFLSACIQVCVDYLATMDTTNLQTQQSCRDICNWDRNGIEHSDVLLRACQGIKMNSEWSRSQIFLDTYNYEGCHFVVWTCKSSTQKLLEG